MKFFNLWNKMESARQYYLRHIQRRDLSEKGKLIDYIKQHPSFENASDEDIKFHLERVLMNADSVVIQHATKFDDIHGVAIVMTVGEKIGMKWVEMPIFLADDSIAANMIVDRVFSKYMADNEFKRTGIYIKVHYDPVVLKALSEKGFEIQPYGEYLLAKYPKVTNLKHSNLFDKYNRFFNEPPEVQSSEEPTAPAGDDDSDDEFGLFKNLPWKD